MGGRHSECQHPRALIPYQYNTIHYYNNTTWQSSSYGETYLCMSFFCLVDFCVYLVKFICYIRLGRLVLLLLLLFFCSCSGAYCDFCSSRYQWVSWSCVIVVLLCHLWWRVFFIEFSFFLFFCDQFFLSRSCCNITLLCWRWWQSWWWHNNGGANCNCSFTKSHNDCEINNLRPYEIK